MAITPSFDFIHDDALQAALERGARPEPARVRAILDKARTIETLTPDETAALLQVTDADLWAEMDATALEIKRKVYDNRIVTFAPLYLSSCCVNDCAYCGFRSSNTDVARRCLSLEEVRAEVESLAGRIGHKRLILVYGEHPSSGIDYMTESIRAVYDVRVPVRRGVGAIRRVNVNAAPMSVDDLKRLKEAGIGTFQVFQETYHHPTYAAVHPSGTLKADYAWRLTAMHRAFEAGIDDVGIGVLFGLYDWRFEVLGLVAHALELEAAYGIGPHTISFPRLEPAHNAPLSTESPHRVSDEDFLKLVTVLRLAIPHAGMIVTAREPAASREAAIDRGCTQTDASTRLGIGAYSRVATHQTEAEQQFLLGDTRSLDEVIRALAAKGMITSFCTAGYRCGRTGACIMQLLKSGREGMFCKLNAVLTFREWLDDFGSEATRAICEPLILREIEEVRVRYPEMYPAFIEGYRRTAAGERDVYY